MGTTSLAAAFSSLGLLLELLPRPGSELELDLRDHVLREARQHPLAPSAPWLAQDLIYSVVARGFHGVSTRVIPIPGGYRSVSKNVRSARSCEVFFPFGDRPSPGQTVHDFLSAQRWNTLRRGHPGQVAEVDLAVQRNADACQLFISPDFSLVELSSGWSYDEIAVEGLERAYVALTPDTFMELEDAATRLCGQLNAEDAAQLTSRIAACRRVLPALGVEVWPATSEAVLGAS